jgi:hypothetical protein
MVYGSQRNMGRGNRRRCRAGGYFTAACVRLSPLATFTPLSVST